MDDVNERQNFGALLRSYRTRAGLSQEELAERAGLSRRGIADLERGARRSPHPATVRRLLEALELDEESRAALLSAARRDDKTTEATNWSAPSGLPLKLTSFVGREREVDELVQRVKVGRLVSR